MSTRIGVRTAHCGSHDAFPVKVTGVKTTGKKTVTLTLDAGQWWFFSGGPSKTYFVVTK